MQNRGRPGPSALKILLLPLCRRVSSPANAFTAHLLRQSERSAQILRRHPLVSGGFDAEAAAQPALIAGGPALVRCLLEIVWASGGAYALPRRFHLSYSGACDVMSSSDSTASASARPVSTYPLSTYWLAALACFILAGTTGAFFRISMAHGQLPWGLSFDNVRRAHSHLMFFSWVTPALMALIAARLERRLEDGFGRPMRLIIGANLALGLATFVPFLLDGYHPTTVLGRSVPLSVIFSTAAMFAWYAFAWVYWRRTRGLRRDSVLALWDLAVVALAVSSLGAWARGALIGMHVDDPFWTNAVVHFFLGLFSDGWLALAALGLVHDQLGVQMDGRRRWWTVAIVAGLPMTFVLGMPLRVVPSALWQLATLGGLLVGLGFVGHAVILWRRAPRGLWSAAIACFALKGLAQMVFIVPAVARWADAGGLRLMYLHVLFLGAVSLTLVESARRTWGNVTPRQSRWMQAAVAVLIITMLPTTTFWPAGWLGSQALWLTAAGSIWPVLAASSIVAFHGRESDGTRPTHQNNRRTRLDDRAHAAPSGAAATRTASSSVVDSSR